ncbi:MAG: RagB/SusD family nutrient uptake outer membrane protein [Dysgonamonadaceae bacterium]|nr:RagB/SusD family nutrient uptake outer membrane protein [Dysgonamonadaceae bacterium]
MKNNIKILISVSLMTMMFSACEFLDETPSAILTPDQVKTDYEGALTAAYSMLGNDHYDSPFSLWPYGTVRSDDAYKGGSGSGDIGAFHFFEISSNIPTTLGETDVLWYNCYVAISRANTAINTINLADDFDGKNARIAEARFLRGHFYFLLKILFKHIPYLDETVAVADYGTVSNVALSNDELWQKIVEDFRFAEENLPTTQIEVGRATKSAAAAYLAKVYLYKAYRQDDPETHGITSINAADLEDALKYAEEVIGSQYGLEDDFAFNFLPGEFENGKESIFAVQFSTNDGTQFGRVNFGDLLSVPRGLGCCDFLKPSQNLVNAFSTQNGLPSFAGFNTLNSGYAEQNDPRLFHTVALPGLPYKYNTDRVYEDSWNRNPGYYGYYASLKENVDPECDCFVPMVPFYTNTKNRIILRFSEVLLIKAEALIELHRHDEALPLINQVRQRAKNSTGYVSYISSKINIDTYKDGTNCTWTEEFARQAMRWERRLELAMEHQRFFDLVRWGIAEEVLNSFYQTESVRRDYYSGANFIKNKHEYVPIPEQQIKFSKYLYKQNVGYN